MDQTSEPTLTESQLELARWLAQEQLDGNLRDSFTLEWRLRDNVPDWGMIRGHPDQMHVSYAQLCALEAAGFVCTISIDKVPAKKSGVQKTAVGDVFQYGWDAHERSRTYTLLGPILKIGQPTQAKEPVPDSVSPLPQQRHFISPELISKLREHQAECFDTARLVKYCEEVNDNYQRLNYSAVAFLSRAILDHCPPVFGEPNFESVAAHIEGRSSKSILSRLNQSLRDISDHHIHRQIGRKEVLPTHEEIDFSNDLNHLISRILEKL